MLTNFILMLIFLLNAVCKYLMLNWKIIMVNLTLKMLNWQRWIQYRIQQLRFWLKINCWRVSYSCFIAINWRNPINRNKAWILSYLQYHILINNKIFHNFRKILLQSFVTQLWKILLYNVQRIEKFTLKFLLSAYLYWF